MFSKCYMLTPGLSSRYQSVTGTITARRKQKLKHNSSNQSEHMRAPGAARYLGLSVSTLAKLRMLSNRSEGPNYSKVNGSVIYRRSDLVFRV